MSDASMPDWINVGTPAFIVTEATYGTPNITPVIIQKVGKRDVVVTGGRRFNGLRSQTGIDGGPDYLRSESSTWRTGPMLVSQHDPRLAKWRKDIEAQRQQNAAHSAYDTWRRDQTAKNAAHVVAAFRAIAEEQDQ